MGLDGLHRQVQARGHLLVRVATGDQAQDLALAHGQLVELGIGDGQLAREGVEHEPGEAGREHGIAGADALDRANELVLGDRLGDVAAGTRTDDGDDILDRVGHRQGQEPDLGPGRAHGLEDRLASPAGQVHVEEHDVGRERDDCGDGRVDIGRLADEVDRVGQLGLHAGAEERVVVDDEDTGRARAGARCRGHRGTLSSHSVPAPTAESSAAVPRTRASRPTIDSAMPTRSPSASAVPPGSNPQPVSRT